MTIPFTEVRPPSPIRSLMAGFVLGFALLGVAAQATPIARADADAGANFLGALSAKGISYASNGAAIAAGHEVCAELDQGRQAGDVANDVMARSNLDGYHAGYFIGASIAAMCPRHNQ
jgi:Protein of unknown function (DUF732)